MNVHFGLVFYLSSREPLRSEHSGGLGKFQIMGNTSNVRIKRCNELLFDKTDDRKEQIKRKD